MKGMICVGDVVKLTQRGFDWLSLDESLPRNIPPIGATAVVKALDDVSFSNPSYRIEFFAYPGEEWEVYGGEVELVGRR